MARRVARSMREARVLRQAEFDDERVPDPLGILTRLEGVGGRAGAQTGQDQVVQQCLRVARIEPLREGGAELRPLHTQRMCARFSTSSAGTVSGIATPSSRAIRSETSRRTVESGTSSAVQIAPRSSEEASFWPRSTSER